MKGAAHLLAALVVLAACKREEPPPVPPPGIPGTAAVDVPSPSAPQSVSPTDPAHWGSRTPVAVSAPANAVSPAAPVPAESPASAPAPVARDLSQELVGLVGAPSGCFSQRTAGSSPQLSFHVTAAVTPTGMITRAEVTGGGLSAEEADCVKAKVVSTRFASPVEGAPLSVHATIDLRERAPEKKVTP